MSDVNYENEVQDGELLKWEKAGETEVEGLLKSYKEQNTSNGVGHVYEVRTKEGTIAFFAPSLLHKKLQDIAIGNLVKIVFEKQTKTVSGNPLKHFKVNFTKATPDKLKALGIELMDNSTDDDGEGTPVEDIPM